MSRILAQVRADKVINKGGGIATLHRNKSELKRNVKAEGHEYLVFSCPACGKRNNRSVKTAKSIRKQTTVFGEEPVATFCCNNCGFTVEVMPPAGIIRI